MPLMVPKVMAEVGLFSFIYLNAIQMPNTWGEFLTPEKALWTAGGLLMVGFYGGRIWRDFLGSKSKIINDDQRIRSLERRLRTIELGQSSLRSTFVALLGKFDIDHTRTMEIGAALAYYDDEEPTDDGST
jgi:hypothetical protein